MLTLTVNGILLSCERIGRGAPLVLLHGYPLDHTIWEAVVPLLQTDFDLILPDLRGFGRSEAPEAPYTLEDMARDIAALLDHWGIKRSALAGHSMGGYVALAFARLYPDRVTGLALVASQAAADTPERRAGRYRTIEEIQHQGIEPIARMMSARLTADASLRPRLENLILQQRPAGLIGALRAMAERLDATAWLAGLSCPVVLIHGQADELIPVERAREVKALIPHATLLEIPAVAHMPMLEAATATAEALRGLATAR